MGDYNGDLGNELGDRGYYDPNVRGLKLIESANFSIYAQLTCWLIAVGLLRLLFPTVGDTLQINDRLYFSAQLPFW